MSMFDGLIIYSRDEKRSVLLDIWRFYVALLSIYSGVLGIYMAAFMLELNGSPFHVTSAFEGFYLVVEVSQYLDLILTFFIEYHDEDRDVYVRDLLEILKNYAVNGLAFDLLASIPFFAIIASVFKVSTKVPH